MNLNFAARPFVLRYLTAVSIGALGCAMTAPLWAQTATAGQGDASSVQAADIVVTAQKRSERLVDVPIAITAVAGEQLASSGVTATQQLGQVVPGLRLDLSGGFSQPTLRGIGSSVAGPGLSASVATYVDGIYRPSQLSSNFELADIESVQVLKGPQGTLFGRNATGGAILVTTRDPSFTTDVRGKISYARFNDIRTSLSASTGITDQIAVGISGQYRHTDGFVTNIFTGDDDFGKADNWNIRGKVLFNASDAVSFLLTLEHNQIDDNSSNAYNAYQGRASANDPAVVAALDPSGAAVDIPTQRGVVSLNAPTAFKVNTDRATLRSKFELGSMTLTSYTGYQDEKVTIRQDYDATRLVQFESFFQPKQKTFSQEFNLASDTNGPLSWVAGLYYFWDDSNFPFYNARFDNSPVVNVFDIGVKTESWAAFADATYDVTDRLHITLGGRYSKDKLREHFEFIGAVPRTEASTSFDSFTPRAVIRYGLADNSNVYASVSKGYKSGAYNAAGGSTDPVDPEKITAYEIGFKTSQARWRLETSAFYYDFKNLQVNRFQGAASVLVNAASARTYGADLQFVGYVTDRLQIQLGGAYTNAQYKDFPAAPGWAGTGFPGDPIRPVSIDAEGFQMLRAPKWTGNASVTYDQPLAGGTLTLFGSYYRTSRFFFDAAHSAKQGGYGLLAARATWKAPGDRFSIGVFGENLTDTKYITQILFEPQAVLQQYGTPRQYGVELGFRF